MKKLTIKECKSICYDSNERVVDVDIYDKGYMAKVISVTSHHVVYEYTLSVVNDVKVNKYVNVLCSGRIEDPLPVNRMLHR